MPVASDVVEIAMHCAVWVNVSSNCSWLTSQRSAVRSYRTIGSPPSLNVCVVPPFSHSPPKPFHNVWIAAGPSSSAPSRLRYTAIVTFTIWTNWLAPTAVVDARWVFASTKAARAYLDAPGTQLLARDGLANPAVLQIGDGAHAWGSARSVPRGRARHCLLFRIDRVVARLDVTEGPNAAQELQTLSRAHLLPYAEAVVRRVRRVLAEYWLAIGHGTVAAQELVQTQPRKAALLFTQYPILLLPEFPTAMASLGDAYRAGAEQLAILQGAARNNWPVYRETLRALVRMLLDETAGEPRINADAALRLVTAHRQLDADQAWAALEAECNARAAGKQPDS